MNSVDRYSNVIRDLIHDAPVPKDVENEIKKAFEGLGAEFVAVRSSATAEDSSIASFAGELETYLNVTKKDLIDKVKTCWSSLFTPRALFYAFEREIFTYDHQIAIRAKTCKKLTDCYPVGVAVVVQKMIQSESAGVAFTVHPVTKGENQMVIESVWGLGELLVSGQATPDTYVIGKKNLDILDININSQEKMMVRTKTDNKQVDVPSDRKEKQILSGKQIQELAKICKKIEKHIKTAQDIEWALEKNKFYIVQSRPITTL